MIEKGSDGPVRWQGGLHARTVAVPGPAADTEKWRDANDIRIEEQQLLLVDNY